jgi:glycerol-3-phosphate dehydrogenase
MRAPLPQRTFERPFDLIVIGAGINGAGIARDATLRGLSVLLVDKGDVGAGTTSRSTRLVSSTRCRSCCRSTKATSAGRR